MPFQGKYIPIPERGTCLPNGHRRARASSRRSLYLQGIAEILFENKKYYNALFFCHLSIEKYLKAIIVKKTHSAPPLVHDLVRLAEKASILLSAKLKNELAEISTFNIEARYDDYKLSFYKKAKKRFTSKYITITKEILKYGVLISIFK